MNLLDILIIGGGLVFIWVWMLYSMKQESDRKYLAWKR